MWTPGETIDKDVYAVNTGSIPAFVKETVSGKLALEYENTVNDFTTTKAVVLSEDEVKLSKAGGFLVWNNAGAENGAVGTDYEPTVSGDYIFRRSIKGDPTVTQHPVFTIGDEAYTLEGFHYDSGTSKYYKIVIDDYKTGKEATNRTTVEVNADGTLKDTPNILYVISDKVEAQPVAFTYEAKNTTTGTPNRLVATYELAPSAAVNYNSDAIAAMHAVKVENAHGEYEFAKYREDVASAEFALLNSLIGQRNTLATAAKTATDALGSQSTANTALNDAYNAVDGKAVMTATLNTGEHEYGDRIFTSSVLTH